MTAYLKPRRVLIVSYQLKGSPSSYAQFYENLKSQGAWAHYLASTWLVSTQKSPEEVFAAIRGNLQSGDFVFVGTLQDGYNGWLPKAAWEWIKAQGLGPSPKL